MKDIDSRLEICISWQIGLIASPVVIKLDLCSIVYSNTSTCSHLQYSPGRQAASASIGSVKNILILFSEDASHMPRLPLFLSLNQSISH